MFNCQWIFWFSNVEITQLLLAGFILFCSVNALVSGLQESIFNFRENVGLMANRSNFSSKQELSKAGSSVNSWSWVSCIWYGRYAVGDPVGSDIESLTHRVGRWARIWVQVLGQYTNECFNFVTSSDLESLIRCLGLHQGRHRFLVLVLFVLRFRLF